MKNSISALGLSSVLLLSVACSTALPGPGALPDSRTTAREVPITEWPLPTENWLPENAESTQKQRRKDWFQEIHRTTPDVDWKSIELENGLAQLEKRNRLGRSAQGVASPWVERGSENQAGRMHVAVYSTDGTTLYAGSSKGGVWKGTTTGAGSLPSKWTPIGDNLYGGAHWLAVVQGANPGDPDVVLAAQDGGLVKVSADDGATWVTPAGLPTLNQIRRVLVTSDGTETVFVMGRANSTVRIYRSVDRMASFDLVLTVGALRGDLWSPRTGAPDLYTATKTSVLKSVDHGATWLTVGTPPSGATHLELTGSEAGAPRLWGVFTRSGVEELYRSDDAGATWNYMRDLSDYWGTLNASIVDPNRFAYGGVEVWRTVNAGSSFTKVNNWYDYYNNRASKLHADIPGIDVWPTGQSSPTGESWFISTDGGLFESTDQLATVQNLSLQGLRVSQYYTTLTSSLNPDRVLAGAQDQGYQRADSPPAATGTSASFDQLISGDYGHLTSGDGSHKWVFSTYPGFILAHVGVNNPQLYQVAFPPSEQYAWLPPVVADDVDTKSFYFCATRLWKYQKNAGVNTWSQALHSTRDFQVDAGEYLSAFTFSPVDSQRAYAASNRGRLYYSDDHGVTWFQSASTGPNAHYFYGTALLASSLDKDTVWVAGSGYGVPAVHRSTDGGQTFQAFGTGLPSTLVYCLGEAPDGSGDIFCGTETAAYMRASGANAWGDITGNAAPVTTYWSLEAHPTQNTMRFGTYGRGIWDYQIDPVARTVTRNGSGANTACFSTLQPPILGSTWNAEVDTSGHPGASYAGFVVHAAPSTGTFFSGGELLVDLGSNLLLSMGKAASGGVESFAPAVPSDPTLAGLVAYAQGYILGGGGYELCNGMEVVVGY